MKAATAVQVKLKKVLLSMMRVKKDLLRMRRVVKITNTLVVMRVVNIVQTLVKKMMRAEVKLVQHQVVTKTNAILVGLPRK